MYVYLRTDNTAKSHQHPFWWRGVLFLCVKQPETFAASPYRDGFLQPSSSGITLNRGIYLVQSCTTSEVRGRYFVSYVLASLATQKPVSMTLGQGLVRGLFNQYHRLRAARLDLSF